MSVSEIAGVSTEGIRDRALPQVPEPGQVVEVRGSTWAVTDVREQGLPRSPADESHSALHHVVTLQSLEEDRLGRELSVVWELEVGHTVAPDQGLPTTISSEGFDDPNTLAAFVDAVRWGAVTSADTNSYQAPFRSGANVEAFQLEPLRRALQAPRANLLLADDVGLGKTIEAGLVIQELLLRHRARTVLVVCPPSLALKWQDEMEEKFGLDFVIVNSELMADVRRTYGLNANPFRLFPRMIVSMAWLPGIRAQRLLRDVYAQTNKINSARRYAFDILVVDEAHHVAPASPSVIGGGRGYAVDSQRTIATRELAERCEHRLFLSATPHNGHSESFTALLEMIDDRRFSRGASIDERALRDVTVRRLKTEIKEKNFHQRVIKTLPFLPNQDEQDAFDSLSSLLRTSARATGKKASGDILAILLKKRFLSSPWAFGTTMALYDQSRDAGQQGRFASVDDEEDYYADLLGSDQSDEEEGEETHPESTALLAGKGGDPLSGADPEEVVRLAHWGQSYAHKPDSRLQALRTFLDGVCRPDGKHWSNERVVIFTEYASTLQWIQDVLEQHGYRDVLATIQGSTPTEDRELTRARFSTDPSEEPVRVLIATDSAGEGIDLQDYCHRLVNFDIPFNPSRLEQRIGRIDRYGQRHAPEIYHLVPSAQSTTYAADVDFLRRIAERVATIAGDLGSVNQVIDNEIQDHFARATSRKRRAVADNGSTIITRTLAGGMELNRQLTDLSRTYFERKEDMHLTPGNSRRVVDTALRLSRQPVLIESGDERTDAEIFDVPALGPAWQPALQGLDTRLNPGVWRSITFDETAFDAGEDDGDALSLRSDLVHVHLGHPLIQKSARILRSSLFSAESSVNRVTAVVIDDLEESCVAAVSRLVLVGRGGLRLHEEVFLTGIRLRGRRLAEAKVDALLDEALDRSDLTLADRSLRERLVNVWNADDNAMRTRLLDAMRQRADTRQQAVTDRLLSRRQADVARAREIFDAFRINLTESRDRLVEQDRDVAMQLFADDQQRQRRKDIQAMEDRLASLDEEERREIATIDERYTDIKPHVAAAAVVFALTPADAEKGLDR